MLVTTPAGPADQGGKGGGQHFSEATEAEQKVGKEAVQKSKERLKKEQEMGKKLMQKAGGGDQSKMESQEKSKSGQPPMEGRG